jgi:hypothetical protein
LEKEEKMYIKQIKSLALGWMAGILSVYLLFGVAVTFDVRDAFASIAKAIFDVVIAVPFFHGSLDWKTLLIIAAGAAIGAVVKFKYDDILGTSEQSDALDMGVFDVYKVLYGFTIVLVDSKNRKKDLFLDFKEASLLKKVCEKGELSMSEKFISLVKLSENTLVTVDGDKATAELVRATKLGFEINKRIGSFRESESACVKLSAQMPLPNIVLKP